MIKVAPSILSAQWSILEQELLDCKKYDLNYIHFDIMDGNFVPTLSFGPKLIADVRKQFPNMFFDVHLMVCNPSQYILELTKAGANACTIHFEEEKFMFRSLEKIASAGMEKGVAINPQTPVSALHEVLPLVDNVLIMSVDPGFGGQKFITSSLDKIEYLYKIREKNNFQFKISVDGGINENTALLVKKSGADVLIMGSAFFSSNNKKELLKKIVF